MVSSIFRLRTTVPSDHPRRQWRLLAFLGLCIGCLALDRPAAAQSPVINYDETKVGLYTLPDPLVGSDGQRSSPLRKPGTRDGVPRS